MDNTDEVTTHEVLGNIFQNFPSAKMPKTKSGLLANKRPFF